MSMLERYDDDPLIEASYLKLKAAFALLDVQLEIDMADLGRRYDERASRLRALFVAEVATARRAQGCQEGD